MMAKCCIITMRVSTAQKGLIAVMPATVSRCRKERCMIKNELMCVKNHARCLANERADALSKCQYVMIDLEVK